MTAEKFLIYNEEIIPRTDATIINPIVIIIIIIVDVSFKFSNFFKIKTPIKIRPKTDLNICRHKGGVIANFLKSNLTKAHDILKSSF